MTIRADGTSTITVSKTPLGNTIAADDVAGVSVQVEKDQVLIGCKGVNGIIVLPLDAAWRIRDCFMRALDESCAPSPV